MRLVSIERSKANTQKNVLEGLSIHNQHIILINIILYYFISKNCNASNSYNTN